MRKLVKWVKDHVNNMNRDNILNDCIRDGVCQEEVDDEILELFPKEIEKIEILIGEYIRDFNFSFDKNYYNSYSSKKEKGAFNISIVISYGIVHHTDHLGWEHSFIIHASNNYYFKYNNMDHKEIETETKIADFTFFTPTEFHSLVPRPKKGSKPYIGLVVDFSR